MFLHVCVCVWCVWACVPCPVSVCLSVRMYLFLCCISVCACMSIYEVIFYLQSIAVCSSPITSMCSIKDTMWLGTEQGSLYIMSTSTRDIMYERTLAINPSTQGIKSILDVSVPDMYHTVVVRKDGYILLMDQTISERNVSDVQEFDNSMYSTELPVKGVGKSLVKAQFHCGLVVPASGACTVEIWCGTNIGTIVLFILAYSRLTVSNKPCINCSDNRSNIASMAYSRGESDSTSSVWALIKPSNALCCVNTSSKQVIRRISCSTYTTEDGESILRLHV